MPELEQRIAEFLGGAKSGDATGLHRHTFLHVFNDYQTWEHLKDLQKRDASEHRILVTDGYTASIFLNEFIFNGQIFFPPGSLITYNKNQVCAGIMLSSPDRNIKMNLSTLLKTIQHRRIFSSSPPVYIIDFYDQKAPPIEHNGASLSFLG